MVAYAVALYGITFMYTYHIKRLVPAFAWDEKLATFTSQSVIKIINNPLNAPHKALQYLISKLAHQGYFAMRGVSIVIALGIIVCFYYTARKWFGFRIALLATFLFATSSWMLHTVRLATPDIMYLSLILALAYGTWIKFNTRRPRLALMLGGMLTIWLLYIPGMVWFVLIGAIWQRKQIKSLFSQNKTLTLIALISLGALLLPLIYALIRDPYLYHSYLGFELSTIKELKKGLVELALVPFRLVFKGSIDPVRNLGRMPYLDLFASVMAVIGAFNLFVFDRKLDRFKILIIVLLLGSAIASVGRVVGLQVLLPVIYLLVAAGISYMFDNWFRVFPNNPFAKSIAVLLIACAVAAVSFYNLNSYFIAWPKSPVTRSTFNNLP